MMCVVKIAPSVKAMGMKSKSVKVVPFSYFMGCVAKAVRGTTIPNTLRFFEFGKSQSNRLGNQMVKVSQ